MNTAKLPLRLVLAGTMAHWLPSGAKRLFYRVPLLWRAISLFLSCAAPKGVSVVKVAGGLLEGWLLAVDLQCEKYYWLGTHEPDLQVAMSDFVRPGMTVYDIGASIGYFTLILARLVGFSGRVFAFEPLPTAMDRLRRQVDLNHQQEVITVVPLAVSDKNGVEVFLIHDSVAMGKLSGSAGRDANYRGAVEVQSVTLDSYVYCDGNPVPDVIKMDIEGGEVKALSGMARILVEARPLMLVEIHGQEAARMVWSTLTECDYQISHLGRGHPEIRHVDELVWNERILARPRQCREGQTKGPCRSEARASL